MLRTLTVFAKRTNWPTTANALAQHWRTVCESGDLTFDLTPSNPTAVGFAPSPGLLALETSCTYKPEPLGLPLARRALVDHFGLDIPPEHCCLTASTSEAYGFLLSLLCDPGSSVLTPTPGYPLLHHLCELHDVARVDYPLAYDGSWYLDLGGLRDAIARAHNPSMLVVISPSNPTGHCLTPAELAAIEEICISNEIALVIDQVFAGYDLPTPHPPPARPLDSPRGCLTFGLGGLSKYAALPQLKLSWMLAAGPRDLVDTAMARLEIIADTYLNLAGPVQHALPSLLSQAAPTRTAIRRRIGANQTFVKTICIDKQSPVTPLHTTHGWTQLLQLPRLGLDDQQWAHELLAQGVRTQPGYLFDLPPGLGPTLAVSLLTTPDVFRPGITRLLETVAQACREATVRS